jgi:DNA-binding NarL/FixJ family response regulator
MSGKKSFLQFELLDTIEIRKQKEKAFEDQLPLLPADPMQERLALDKVELSEREFQILSSVLSGYSIAEIALAIPLSIAGVKFRLSSIYRKFGVYNRLELIKKSTKESLQFYVENSPIKQVFHNKLNFADFKGDPNEP